MLILSKEFDNIMPFRAEKAGITMHDIRDTLILGVALLALLSFLALDIALLVSIAKQGDERRQMIVGRASTNSFAVMAVYMVYCVIEDLYRGMALGLPSEKRAPVVLLTVMALCYFVNLLYYRRKYGA